MMSQPQPACIQVIVIIIFSSPCQNSGTCYNLVGDYVCVCTAGYTGDQCQTEIDECLRY